MTYIAPGGIDEHAMRLIPAGPADVAAYVLTKMRVGPDEPAVATEEAKKTLAESPPPAGPKLLAGMSARGRASRRHNRVKIGKFRNTNGVISLRVEGMLRGIRIRRNFKCPEDAVAEVRRLEVQQQADDRLRPG